MKPITTDELEFRAEHIVQPQYKLLRHGDGPLLVEFVVARLAIYILVTAPVGDTDPGESDIPEFGARTKAQYCPIQVIPLILFRHLSSFGHHYKDDYITVDHLYEVWQFAFDSAAEGVDEPHLDDSETSLVCVSLREDIA
ncbi:hypothetical protein B0H14DRAFT_2612620 [Mycena olivaceomarginata]|nr:hypothetical protein B0H14DRAFT_2612620 [Mycena olivaceomarginata]